MPAIQGYNAALLMSSPPSVALASNFALQDSGDHTTFLVSAANSAYRYWDTSSVFTFQTAPDGSTWSNTTPKVVQYLGGKVTFASAVSGATPSARVTAGNYFPYGLLAQITAWSFDGQMSFADNTVMTGQIGGGGGSPFKTFQPMQLEGAFSVTKFWVPESSVPFAQYLTSATPLVLSGVEATGNRYEGMCFLKKGSIKTDVTKLVDEALDLQLSGQFYPV